MPKALEFDGISELLDYLQVAFVRSVSSEADGPEILEEKKRQTLSRFISGFANAGGGNLFIGGTVKGKRWAGVNPVLRHNAAHFEALISQLVFPAITGLTTRFYPLTGDADAGILHVYIPDSPQKPFMASDYRYYLRNGLRDILLEEQQVRALYHSGTAADLELAAIINTNGIPEYSDGRLTEIRFYPKFLIRNNGNAPSDTYKFELHIPSGLHNTSFTALQNCFTRLEGPCSVFTFPSRSVIFQEEIYTIAEARLDVSFDTLSQFLKHELKIVLFTAQGIKTYRHRLAELFTLDRKPLSPQIFEKTKPLK